MPIEIKMTTKLGKFGRTEMMLTPEEEKELFDAFSAKAREIRDRRLPAPVTPEHCEICGDEAIPEVYDTEVLCEACKEIIANK